MFMMFMMLFNVWQTSSEKPFSTDPDEFRVPQRPNPSDPGSALPAKFMASTVENPRSRNIKKKQNLAPNGPLNMCKSVLNGF